MDSRENDKRSLLGALTPPTSHPDGTSHRSAKGTFVPGTVFAGRYRMITCLGAGGMGEVWRADDLVLKTQVALKLLYSTRQSARQRLLKEVLLARSITHPAVCRVYDVGEAEGQVFYTMELVEGEDLATLLRRAGRLPEERVVDIGCQLCQGIAAAHAQGVLHRDLKPANVLIDANGSIRITDFGIATWRSDGAPRTLIGTPGYMAAEQLTAGSTLTERTDVYAAGVIVYELLVGERPASGPTELPRPRPSSLVADVSPHVERAILKALAPAPADRHASAVDFAVALSSIGRATTRLPRWAVPAGIAALALLVVVGAVFAWRSVRIVPSAALTDHDTIVLADFVNATDDPVFDGTMKVATTVALEQSPFLKVFPDEAIRDTLKLMARAPGERVTRSLARDIARREGLKALVSGSISPLGSHYVITLEAINAESGDVTARQQVEVGGKEGVLTALGQATAKLRESLGESLPSIRKFDAPLARATTPSLDALHAYSLALDEGRLVFRQEAIPHLQRAIELDPDFALAHAMLSAIYTAFGQLSEAQPHARRAFELRDRVSERERFLISWRYYNDALEAWDKALELTASWTASYPREAFAFNSHGVALATLGQHSRALEEFARAIELDPRFIPPYRNTADSLIALSRFDEAKAIIDRAEARSIRSVGLRQMRYMIAFVAGNEAEMAAAISVDDGADARMWSLSSQARAASFSGRIQAAHDLFNRGIQLALDAKAHDLATRWMIEDAEAHAIVSQCAETRREVNAALELAPRGLVAMERGARALALCGGAEPALRLTTELSTRFSEATLATRLELPLINAIIALDRRDADHARQLLEPVRPYDYALSAELWPNHLRGRAHLLRRVPAAAAQELLSILDHLGASPA
jgi:serine/threonine protein kinase/Tfp pilus assembly protein PilF